MITWRISARLAGLRFQSGFWKKSSWNESSNYMKKVSAQDEFHPGMKILNRARIFIPGWKCSSRAGNQKQIKILTVSLCSTICDIYTSWKFFTWPTPHTPWKFPLFNPHPLGISIDHPWGVWIFSGITHLEFFSVKGKIL